MHGDGMRALRTTLCKESWLQQRENLVGPRALLQC